MFVFVLGKAFAVLSVADNAIPLISGTCYSTLYNATIHYQPNAIYYLTMSTQIVVFTLMLFINFTTSEEDLHCEVDNEMQRNPEVVAACLEENDDRY